MPPVDDRPENSDEMPPLQPDLSRLLAGLSSSGKFELDSETAQNVVALMGAARKERVGLHLCPSGLEIVPKDEAPPETDFLRMLARVKPLLLGLLDSIPDASDLPPLPELPRN